MKRQAMYSFAALQLAPGSSSAIAFNSGKQACLPWSIAIPRPAGAVWLRRAL